MRMRFLAALLALALLAGCTRTDGSSPSATAIPTATIVEPTTHTITGTVTLGIEGSIKTSISRYGECRGMSGYDDINVGLQVLVKDGAGQILAVGALGPGRIAYRETASDGYEFINCRWDFAVEDVPSSAFYSLSLGRRGAPTYAHDDLAAAGWTVALTIGM